MGLHKLFLTPILLQAIILILVATQANSGKVFREYIGALFKNTKFSDVPINPNVDFHFILAFAIDYSTDTSPPTPTDGNFRVFWDSNNLSPAEVSSIKSQHSNVKVSLSLGGATVSGSEVVFTPSSIDSWVSNAVSSLTGIIRQNNLDGIDIDYEKFNSDPDTFAECIGRLISTLKSSGVITTASIAPFDNPEVQSHYQALWGKYGSVIDYVNFQFYAYDKSTTVDQFLDHFNAQTSSYNGAQVLVSFATDGVSGGLTPEAGFFDACNKLKDQNRLSGIFIWCADTSKDSGFTGENQSQELLANNN